MYCIYVIRTAYATKTFESLIISTMCLLKIEVTNNFTDFYHNVYLQSDVTYYNKNILKQVILILFFSSYLSLISYLTWY